MRKVVEEEVVVDEEDRWSRRRCTKEEEDEDEEVDVDEELVEGGDRFLYLFFCRDNLKKEMWEGEMLR